jgi:predicted PurR-regulated permease PerM
MIPAENQLTIYRRTVAVIIAVIILVLAFMIIRPFLEAIIAAAVLAYLFYPVYKLIQNYLPGFLPKESIAAMTTCLLIIIIVLVPTAIITGLLTREIKDGYFFLQKIITSPNFNFDLPPFIAQRLGNLSQYKELIGSFGGALIGWMQVLLKGIPNVILSIFITIFSIYFFLKGGSKIFDFVQKFLPLPEGRYPQIFKRFDDLSRGMVMGQIVVGLIQGFLAGFIFMLLGVPNPVLWGFLTSIISIIPLLGAALVWLPVTVYLFLAGYGSGIYWKAIVLFFFGMFVISTIDNILKPKIVGERANVHPLIILFGILGGIHLIGIPGILIGPMILTLLPVVMEIFKEAV